MKRALATFWMSFLATPTSMIIWSMRKRRSWTRRSSGSAGDMVREGVSSMEVRWGRVLFVFGLFVLIAFVLWMRQNTEAMEDAWDSLTDGVSDIVENDAVQAFFHLGLTLGFFVFMVWLLSRMIGWFRR
jgi:hypothetical protein